ALHLTVMWGGRPIDAKNGNPILRFQYADQTPPLEIRWEDLASAWQTSGCSDEMIETLDGPMRGVALICDGRIDIARVRYIEAITNTGDKRIATSWASYVLSELVHGVSIQLLH